MSFITLYKTKLYNEYTYIKPTTPNVTEKEPLYLNGETWLDSSTGYSYELLNNITGVWRRIEQAKDTKILALGEETFFRTIRNIQNPFVVDRPGQYDDSEKDYKLDSPDEFTREELYNLFLLESVYSEFTFNSAEKTVTAGGDIWGALDSFNIGDTVLINGGLRNDGYFTITNRTDTILTVDENIVDSVSKCFIYLVRIPQDFIDVVSRMVHFDVFVRQNDNDLSSERIGTYSYTLKPTTGGTAYPADIANELSSYEGVVLGGASVYVP
jgi:hypothetical protein